jgi:hypothetical protein
MYELPPDQQQQGRPQGRFAQGFGARQRLGLGQQAADAARGFYSQAPQSTHVAVGEGRESYYEKPEQRDLTPVGYRKASYVDSTGVRHDYNDKIGDPMDTSWMDPNYHKPEATAPPPVTPTAAPPVTPPPVSTPAPPPPPPPRRPHHHLRRPRRPRLRPRRPKMGAFTLRSASPTRR